MIRRTPLRKVSSRRKEELKFYRKLKHDYIADHMSCEVCLDAAATDIHHKLPLGRGGKLCDTSIFMAVCRFCHSKIHNLPKWAEQQGYLTK